MKLRQDTVQVVSELAKAAVAMPTDATEHGESIGLGLEMGKEFYDQNWPLYQSTINTLVQDPALKNRSYEDIQNDLWALLNELIRHRHGYAESRALKKRLKDFREHLPQKTEDYEVAFGIDGISLPNGEIKIGRTTFCYWDEERVRLWELPQQTWAGWAEDVSGKVVGLVSVQAGSFTRAWELAAEEVDRSLNIMRAAMASAHASPPMDELFLQERSSHCVAKRLGDEPSFEARFGRRFKHVELDLRDKLLRLQDPLLEAARDLGAQVAALCDGTIPTKLGQSLLRALEWIGSSVSRESYDDKIVDLCTALECMLTVESDGLKGEKIALRYILLTGLRSSLYIMPHATLPIYRRRSEIVHGAGRHIAGRSDYTAMREIAMRTFSMIFYLAKTDKNIENVAQLIKILGGDQDEIETALFILDGERVKDDRDVEKYARSVLKKLRQEEGSDCTAQIDAKEISNSSPWPQRDDRRCFR